MSALAIHAVTFRQAILSLCLLVLVIIIPTGPSQASSRLDIQGLSKRHGIEESKLFANADATFNTPSLVVGLRALLPLYVTEPQQMTERGVLMKLLIDDKRYVMLHSDRRSSVGPGYTLTCAVDVLDGVLIQELPYPVPIVKEVDCLSSAWKVSTTRTPADKTKDVLVKSYSCARQKTHLGDFVHYQGEIQNQTDVPLQHVVAVVILRSTDGEFVSTDDVLIAYSPLLPRQSAPFRGIASHVNPIATRCEIGFRLFSGPSLTHATALKAVPIRPR
jgi:hypothetical protein